MNQVIAITDQPEALYETDRVMRQPEVLEVLGVSKTTLWRWINEGIFPPPVMRQPEVLEVLGVAKTTLWRWINEGIFPRPVQPGGPNSRTKGWLKSDVDEYFANLKKRAA